MQRSMWRCRDSIVGLGAMHGRLGGYPVAQHLNFKEGLSWVGMVVEAPEPDSKSQC